MPRLGTGTGITSLAVLGGGRPPWLYGPPLSSLANLVAAVRGARAGTGGPYRFLFLGDSTTAGAQAGATAAKNRVNSYPAQIADILAARGAPAQINNWLGGSGAGSGASTPADWDDRISTTGSVTVSAASPSLGGPLMLFDGSGDAISFQCAGLVDTVQVFHATAQSGRISVKVDGVQVGTTSGTNQAFNINTFTIDPATDPVITLEWVSSNPQVAGISAYNSATPQIQIVNAGRGSATTANVAFTTYNFSSLNSIDEMASDCHFISLGINDILQSVALATTIANLESIIEKCLLSGDVILLTQMPISSKLSEQADLVSAYYTLADQYGVPLIDTHKILGTYAQANAAGLYGDANHPNRTGYSRISAPLGAMIAAL